MGIRDKLVIIFFILIIIPMFVLWARWQETSVGSTKSVLRRSLAERSREISDQIATSLKTQEGQVTELARQSGLAGYARELSQNGQAVPDGALRIDLSAFMLAHQSLYSTLIGVNREGRPLFRIEVRPSPNGVIRPFYSDGLDGQMSAENALANPSTVLGSPAPVIFSEIEQAGGESGFRIIAPLRVEGGGVSGALVILARASRLFAEVAGSRTAPSGPAIDYSRPQVIVTTPQGVVLHAAEESKRALPLREAFPAFGGAIGSPVASGEADTDAQPWFIHQLSRDASPRLSILVVENYSSAISQLEFDSYVLLLLTFLLVIVAMLSIYFLISGTTDSIRQVTRGARAIASGNLGYNIEVRSRDETRVLAEAFNRMAGRLREMIRKEGEQKQFESFARLSAVLTHDLKNQILSLSLLVSNMERKFDREGFREDAMRTLSDSVSNLQNLVSKLSDPRTPTRRVREEANLTHLVERVIQRTAAQASGRFQISTQLTPDLQARVDGKAIERVIENLVINAIEAMPDGGSLMISARRDRENAIISVADTGKGMTEEFMRDRLFHPFATTKKKGIGLGLYSCRDIIEQHGGRIDVASQVGVGTEFSVILPLKSDSPEAEETREDSIADR